MLRRDGGSCPFTRFPFRVIHDEGVVPILTHVIPNSVQSKLSGTILSRVKTCLTFPTHLARYHDMHWHLRRQGRRTAELVRTKLNSLGNIMNIQSDAHTSFNDLFWGIEARINNGTVRIYSSIRADLTYLLQKVKYIYRKLSGDSTVAGPIPICLRDGEEIHFGRGLEADRLGPGPDPLLCNFQLAVARVLKTSGAAELIMQWMEDADDSDFPHVYIASSEFCDILVAKLLLSGRALVI